jgi:purine-cytosine permease-like protein
MADKAQDRVENLYSISDAQPSLSEDQSARARRYFISMMIRTFCFILAVILPSPYRWIALIGAVTLPYIAVIVANAGKETIRIKSNKIDNIKTITN